MESADVERIQELLSQKANLFETLLTVIEKQSHLSYFNDFVECNNIMEQRSILIAEIQKIDVILSQFSEKYGDLYEQDRSLESRIEPFNIKIRECVKRILEIDELNKVQVMQDFNLVKDKLKQLRQGKKGNSIYLDTAKSGNIGVYTDNKG